jgi:hypothetical protein
MRPQGRAFGSFTSFPARAVTSRPTSLYGGRTDPDRRYRKGVTTPGP